ncbi:MAG: hypothetical protein KDK64_00300 [Chlamydiia bacterium]|nr:hypothetical protein [Chlamydiia bacterium]
MAIPFTLTQIKSYVDEVTSNALEATFTDADLQELSSNEGRTLEGRATPYNIRMGWHHNQAGEVNGIFLCRFDHESLQAWRLIKGFDPHETPYELTVFQNRTTPATTMAIHVGLLNGIFKRCKGTAHAGPVTFNYPADQITDQEAIRKFFGKQRDFLPPSIRDVISPPPRRDPPPRPQNPHRVFYYLAAFALVAGVIKVTQWALAKPKPQPQPRPVTPQRS